MTITINSVLGDEPSPNTTILYEQTFSRHLNISESTQYTDAAKIRNVKKTKMGRTDPDETSTPSPNLGINIMKSFKIILCLANQWCH